MVKNLTPYFTKPQMAHRLWPGSTAANIAISVETKNIDSLSDLEYRWHKNRKTRA
jgi:hypothetical protein